MPPALAALLGLVAGAVAAAVPAIAVLRLRRRAEGEEAGRLAARLGASEAALRSFFEEAGVGIFALGAEGRLVRYNRSFSGFLARAGEDVAGRPLLSFVHPADRLRGGELVAAVADGEEPSGRAELRWVRADGTVRWGEVRLTAPVALRELSRPAGEPILLTGVVTDVTEQHALQQVVREAEERWQLALEANRDGTWDWEVGAEAVFLSEDWRALLGFVGDDMPSGVDALPRLVHPDDWDAASARLAAFLEGRGTKDEMELRLRHRDGSVRWCSCRAAVERDEGGRARRLVGTYRDITDRKLAEMQLRTLSLAVEQSPVAVLITDPQGVIRYVNPRFTEITGYSPAEAVGKTPGNLRTGRIGDELAGAFWETIRSGGVWRGEVKNRRRDGTVFWALASVAAVKGGDGQVTGFVATQEDITERKRAEQELSASRDALEARSAELAEAVTVLSETRDELARAKEVAEGASRAKGEFLANMSHEIRTPMNAIIGLSHLALQTELTAKQRDYVARVHRSAQNLLAILNDILDVSKVEAGKLSLEHVPFDLEEVLDNVATVLSPRASEKDLELLVAAEPGVPRRLVGDPLRLGQVLLNLAGNAVKFTERGEVVVRATVAGRDDSGVDLRFEVRDTGIGLDEEQVSRLFQPFSQADSSTTRRFGGTGLGLAIAARLVELMGGKIAVTSVPGQGSVFAFTARFASTAQAARELAAPPDLRGLRVLVVDDSEAARIVALDLLGSMGFRAEAASSGPEGLAALEAASAAGAPFRAVLMDWKMSPWDGIETFRRAQEDGAVSPKPAVVMMTAHGREEVLRQAEAAGIQGFLLKPVSPSLLLNTLVDRVLGLPGVPRLDREEVAAARRVESLRGARVLVVDDNEINRQVALEVLEAAGAEVLQAADGQEALREIRRDPPDLVLMDVQMPVLDGLSATRALREDPAFARLPVLAMTAHAMAEERQRCLAAGMDDHVTKPIDPDVLLDTVERHLARVGFVAEGSGERPAAAAPAPPSRAGGALEEALPAGVPGFDEAEALRRVGGNRSLLGRLLRDFARSFGGHSGALAAALEGGDAAGARSLAHALKGVAGNLALGAVRDGAARLESALREGRADDAQARCAELMAALGGTLAALEAWTRGAPPAAPRPGAATAVDPGSAVPRLDELARLLAEGNLKAEEAFRELCAVLPSSADAARAAVEAALDGLDYEAALQALGPLAAAAGVPWQHGAT